MEYPIQTGITKHLAPLLCEIPQPPSQLFYRGNLPPQELSTLAVVGSRNYTSYGKQVVEYLIGGLRGYPVAIISGLALGIDSLAHKTALGAGLYTLAVPGSGLNDAVLYPRTNRGLARNVLDAGGGLLSEFEPDFKATQWSFPQRNRIMVGLSHAVLLIEAAEKSGTLITARLTTDYNRELLAVPGNIFHENSHGTHQFIKLGATPVTTPEDILLALHIDLQNDTYEQHVSLPDAYQPVLIALNEPRDRDSLIRLLSLHETQAIPLLMQMELEGFITERNGVIYKNS